MKGTHQCSCIIFLLFRWEPCFSPPEHSNTQHGKGSGLWEVLRGREGAGKQGFRTPWDLLHEKCVSSSPGRTRTKELDCSMGECKRKILSKISALSWHILKVSFLFHFLLIYFSLFKFNLCFTPTTWPQRCHCSSCCRDLASSTHTPTDLSILRATCLYGPTHAQGSWERL